MFLQFPVSVNYDKANIQKSYFFLQKKLYLYKHQIRILLKLLKIQNSLT